MRGKFLRFEESRARVFDEIGIYLSRSHSEPLTCNISRIAAACGLITGHYQHARHAQTNAVHKRPKDWDERGKRAGKKNFTMNYRMILQPALSVRAPPNNGTIFWKNVQTESPLLALI